MAQRLKVLGIKPDNPSVSPGTYLVEGKKRFLQLLLQSPPMHSVPIFGFMKQGLIFSLELTKPQPLVLNSHSSCRITGMDHEAQF